MNKRYINRNSILTYCLAAEQIKIEVNHKNLKIGKPVYVFNLANSGYVFSRN